MREGSGPDIHGPLAEQRPGLCTITFMCCSEGWAIRIAGRSGRSGSREAGLTDVSSTISQLERSGELPGTQIGKGWLFLREDVMVFLRERIERDTQVRRDKRSSNAAKPLAISETRPNGRRKTTSRTAGTAHAGGADAGLPQMSGQVAAAQARISFQDAQIAMSRDLRSGHVR